MGITGASVKRVDHPIAEDRQPLIDESSSGAEDCEHVIEWSGLFNAAVRSKTARQLRIDKNNSVVKVSFFGGRSIETVNKKMRRNPKDAAANKLTLLKIERSLKSRFGEMIGNAVYNQIFARKIQVGRPVAAKDIIYANSLGAAFERKLTQLIEKGREQGLSGFDTRRIAEEEFNKHFQEALIDDISNLSQDVFDDTKGEFSNSFGTIERRVIERVSQMVTDRRAQTQQEIEDGLKSQQEIIFQDVILMTDSERHKFCVDIDEFLKADEDDIGTLSKDAVDAFKAIKTSEAIKKLWSEVREFITIIDGNREYVDTQQKIKSDIAQEATKLEGLKKNIFEQKQYLDQTEEEVQQADAEIALTKEKTAKVDSLLEQLDRKLEEETSAAEGLINEARDPKTRNSAIERATRLIGTQVDLSSLKDPSGGDIYSISSKLVEWAEADKNNDEKNEIRHSILEKKAQIRRLENQNNSFLAKVNNELKECDDEIKEIRFKFEDQERANRVEFDHLMQRLTDCQSRIANLEKGAKGRSLSAKEALEIAEEIAREKELLKREQFGLAQLEGLFKYVFDFKEEKLETLERRKKNLQESGVDSDKVLQINEAIKEIKKRKYSVNSLSELTQEQRDRRQAELDRDFYKDQGVKKLFAQANALSVGNVETRANAAKIKEIKAEIEVAERELEGISDGEFVNLLDPMTTTPTASVITKEAREAALLEKDACTKEEETKLSSKTQIEVERDRIKNSIEGLEGLEKTTQDQIESLNEKLEQEHPTNFGAENKLDSFQLRYRLMMLDIVNGKLNPGFFILERGDPLYGENLGLLVDLLRLANKTLADDQSIYVNSNLQLWAVARDKVELVLLPELESMLKELEEKKTLSDVDREAKEEIERLLNRPGDLPPPRALKRRIEIEQQVGDLRGLAVRNEEQAEKLRVLEDLLKHHDDKIQQDNEALARRTLMNALSLISKGGKDGVPLKIALDKIPSVEVRKKIFQLIKLKKEMIGALPNADQRLLNDLETYKKALEESGVWGSVATEIRKTGKVDAKKFEDIKKKKIEEIDHIQGNLDKVEETRKNLKKIVAQLESAQRSGIPYLDKQYDLEMLRSLGQIEKRLVTLLEDAENQIPVLDTRIKLANGVSEYQKKLKDLDDRKKEALDSKDRDRLEREIEALKIHYPFSSHVDNEYLQHERISDAEQSELEDEFEKLANKHVFLETDDEDKVTKVLAGEVLPSDSDELDNTLDQTDGVFLNDKPKSRSTAPERKNISVILAQLGLKTNPTKGDGNCLFHAINSQLQSSRYPDVNQMRQELADLAQAEANRIEQARRNGTSGDPPPDLQAPLEPDQIRDLRARPTDGVPKDKNPLDLWGDIGLHGPYIARLTNRPVVCFSPNEGVMLYKKGESPRPLPALNIPRDSILVAYNGINHYEAVSGINANALPVIAQQPNVQSKTDPGASYARSMAAVVVELCPKEVFTRTGQIDVQNVHQLQTWLAKPGADPKHLTCHQLATILRECGPEGTLSISPAAYAKAKGFLMVRFFEDRVKSKASLDEADDKLNECIKKNTQGILGLSPLRALASDPFKHTQKGIDARKKIAEINQLTTERNRLKGEDDNLLGLYLEFFPQNKDPQTVSERQAQFQLTKTLHDIRTKSADPFDLLLSYRLPVADLIKELEARQYAERGEAIKCFSDQAANSFLEALKVFRLQETIRSEILSGKEFSIDGQRKFYQERLRDLEPKIQETERAMKMFADWGASYDARVRQYDNAGSFLRLILDNPHTDENKKQRIDSFAGVLKSNDLLTDQYYQRKIIKESLALLPLLGKRYPEVLKTFEKWNKHMLWLTT